MGPSFGVRANTVAFGHILTRLTAAKEDGAFVTTRDGSKIALGIPKAQKEAVAATGLAYADIPLRRAGTATEAASVILAVASPLFSYVSGETIMVSPSFSLYREIEEIPHDVTDRMQVTGGRNM